MNADPNDMMMELFRSEVESHSELLTSSLLTLEQDATAATALERIMRAAHSIKGAARIVRVEPAVAVAHAMEDCVVAAQKGKLTLTSDDVDIMLRGVDILVKISAATKDAQTDWSTFGPAVQSLVAELNGVLTGTAAKTAPASSASTSRSEAKTQRSSAAVIKCPDILDASAAERVRCELLSALEAGSRELQFDLAATRDLDAVGLAFLAAAKQHVARLPHATLQFQPVSEDMRTVLKVTGLDAPMAELAAQ